MTANSTPESFDAVLAEMREGAKAWTHGAHPYVTHQMVSEWADRLQSAHARELAEQQAAHAAEVGELRDRLISASCYERLCDAELSASRARAEAAEARADAAMGLVAKWLEEADEMDRRGEGTGGAAYMRAEANKIRARADELQQALAGGERKDG